ncbi:type II toxin-antitoxin system VapC family toxin [Candidatus Woesearchaeota archaeon]|nr:type II toxin-antitoxin system VapC family toxin [Candidatus Woesearchaeota archaeon]
MYCFDTNIAIDIFRGDRALRRKLELAQKLGVDVSITLLSLCELLKGAYLSSRRDEALALIQEFARNITLLNLSGKSCELFAMDYAYLKEKGIPLPELDLLIGSVAKAEGKIFVTRNAKHFNTIPDLKVEVW